jgi:hypothetical protein
MSFIFCIDKALVPEGLDIPNEATRVYLDEGNIFLEEDTPEIPDKLIKTLRSRLARATKNVKRNKHRLLKIDYAFNTHFIDPDESTEELNVLEIRDAFLEFMSTMMQHYTKCLIAP